MSELKSIRDLMVQKKADAMVYRWMPRRKTEENTVGFTENLGRALTEELLFFPSKVVTLATIVSVANKVKPSLLFILYMGIISLLFFVPVVICQAVWWQVKRMCKGLWYVLTGRVAYQPKHTTKNK